MVPFYQLNGDQENRRGSASQPGAMIDLANPTGRLSQVDGFTCPGQKRLRFAPLHSAAPTVGMTRESGEESM